MLDNVNSETLLANNIYIVYIYIHIHTYYIHIIRRYVCIYAIVRLVRCCEFRYNVNNIPAHVYTYIRRYKYILIYTSH